MKNLIIVLLIMISVANPLFSQKIAFLENPAVPVRQPELIAALRSEGYTVDVSYTPVNFMNLAGYDLVILGRAVSSGDFTDNASWNALNVPVLILNSYCLRSSRLKLINTASVVPTSNGSAVSTTMVTNAIPVRQQDGSADPVFSGISEGVAAFAHLRWFYDYVDCLPSDFNLNANTGKPLAVLSDDSFAGKGRVIMARWEPGKEAYPGAGVHLDYRSYINIGADDNSTPVNYNYSNYTEVSLKLFLNEVAFLSGRSEMVRITAQPVSISVSVGASAVFSVTAVGKDLSYQWKKDGVDIPGANSSVYTIGKAGAADEAMYTVVVSGSSGSPVTSDAAGLTVKGSQIAFLRNPDVTGNQDALIQALKGEGYNVDVSYIPFNFSSLAGYDLVILGRAVSSGDFTDYISWNALNVPVLILNSYCLRSSRLKLVNTASVVSSPDGSAISTSMITSAKPLPAGDGTYDAVFNGISSGGAEFAFSRWFYDYIDYSAVNFSSGSNTGKPLVVLSGNATKGAGTIQMVRWEPGKEAYPGSGVHAGYRSYINIGADDSANPVHYNYCNYTDASLRLFLNEVAFLACGEIRKSECISPSISGQPQGITAIAGTQAEVAVTASGTNLSYQWFKNGTEITGAGSAVYTISSVSSGDAGTYYVKVSGSCGSPAVSAQASIIVCSVPVITLNPQNVTGEAGSTVSFSVNASGTGLTYQWRKDGSNIAGATSETFRISNIQSSNEGSYSVIVSGSCGSPVTSNSASLTVTPQILLAADYYVATNGSDSNQGTFDRPFATWQKGFNALSAGQTLCIRGGTYYANSTTFGSHYCGVVVDSRQGTASSKYMVVAYPGEKPVLDCRNIKGTSYRRYGIYLTRCEYWHLKGLEITRVDQVSTGGFYIGAGLEINRGNHNTIENCVSHHNGGYGFGTREEAYNTLFLNCDSYSNFDQYSATPGDDADGWDVGYASGNPIITLEGCRSWNNGDDGFDMYQGSGYSGIYYLKNCWSWHNGYRPDGITAGGNGCGFKYGLDGQSYDGVTRRYTYNCIAYDNRKRGFSQESANVKKIFYNCISYNNHAWGWSFWGIDLPDILRNNIAFGDGIEQPGSTRISDHNSWNGGVTVTSADFMSIDGSELLLPRKEDGSLPDIKFLKLNTGSDLIGAGIDVGLPYFGYHPDLGPFESTDLTKGESIENITDNSGSKNEEELFRIYPNPVHDRLNILWNSAEGNILVRLFSSTGIKLYEGIVTGDSFIDMSSYPSGMYVLHVYGGGEFRMMKIVK